MNSSAVSASRAELPKPVGRYVALHPIGAGGMARVYLGARHTPNGLEEQVAIKELKADAAEDHRVLAAFLGEARISTRLDHPNVVRCYEVVADPPNYYLVMEFLAGQSLLQIVRRLGWHGVPRDLHIWILTQLLAGLEHAHELSDARGQPLGVVHCDVSPSNLIVGYDGRVKLLDFGIAKASGALATTHERPVRGKLGYIAPELCLGEPADVRSDLYAVGVMLWEAIACRRRLSADTATAILRARLEDSEKTLESVCPSAPPALLEITRRALARLPAARYSSARDLRRDLELYLAGQPNKVGRQQAATLLEQRFAQDRAKLLEVIEAHGLAAPGRSAVPPPAAAEPSPGDAVPARAVLPSWLTDDADEITSPIPVDRALLIMSQMDGPRPLEPAAPAQTAKRARALRWVAPGAIAAAALAGLIVSQARPSLQAVGAAETETSHPLDLSVTAMGAIGRAPPAVASKGKVALRIEVKPSHTRIRLDGRLLNGNPYLTTVERDELVHELDMTAEGYKPTTRVLRFDDDVDLEISLVPADDDSRHTSTHSDRAPTREPSFEPDHKLGERIEPGMDLQPRVDPRVRRKIDEKDPYGQ